MLTDSVFSIHTSGWTSKIPVLSCSLNTSQSYWKYPHIFCKEARNTWYPWKSDIQMWHSRKLEATPRHCLQWLLVLEHRQLWHLQLGATTWRTAPWTDLELTDSIGSFLVVWIRASSRELQVFTLKMELIRTVMPSARQKKQTVLISLCFWETSMRPLVM